MSYLQHALVSIGGDWTPTSLGGETWSFGVRVACDDAPYLPDPQAYADAIATPLSNWFHGAGNWNSQYARMNYVKVNNIAPDGTYLDPTTHQHTFSGGVLGTRAALTPMFCSIAITLDSTNTSGLARKGRIYPPFGLDAFTGGAVMSGTDQAAILTYAKGLLTLLAITAPGSSTQVRPMVVSRGKVIGRDAKGNPNAWGPGAINRVKLVSLDNVLDVQRRRKNQLAAVRIAAAFP